MAGSATRVWGSEFDAGGTVRWIRHEIGHGDARRYGSQYRDTVSADGHFVRLSRPVEFCDLAGLRMLISFPDQAGARGPRVRVVSISDAARTLTDLAGMQSFGPSGGAEDDPGPAE